MRTEWFLGPGLLKINGDREMNLQLREERYDILNVLETYRGKNDKLCIQNEPLPVRNVAREAGIYEGLTSHKLLGTPITELLGG